ncbi:MAG: FAD-dependent oxidoreductase [Thermoleophilia bacterium]
MDAARTSFDVIVVGAGPAGIFAALELVRRDGLRVALVERGPDISRRACPARKTGICTGCEPCDITCGWGGAGAFSDGKLTLSPEVGGWLDRFVAPGRLLELIQYVDGIWLEYGATDEVHGGGKKADRIRRQALLHGMTLVAAPVRHMGTERSYDILTRMRAELEKCVTVRTGVMVERIVTEKKAGESDLRATGVVLGDGTRLSADAVIVAPGREGAGWLVDECRRLHIGMRTNPVDIGVRVEVAAAIMEPLTDALYESKLIYYTPSFDDPVRTFCMNPYGEVSIENYGDVVTVNGHSYAAAKTDRTNFALLVSTDFTEPFDDPLAYGKSIARLANLIGKGIIVQRLGDLQQGQRSTAERLRRGTIQPTLRGATPGDLAFVLPYRHLRDILDMLETMDKLAPGVNGRDTLLYGVEVKFYSARPELDEGLQTPVKNLYAVGDGAGVTRGLIQASAAGVIAARSILNGGRPAA